MTHKVKNLSAMWETQVWGRKIPWRRKWQPIPVFLPGKSHGQRSLAGYSPWGRKESDTTKRLHFTSYLNGLVVFPTFFNLSLNLAIRSSWMSHSQLPVLFLLTVWSFSICGCKEYNQSDFGVDHLVMPMCRVFSCIVKSDKDKYYAILLICGI